MKTNRNHPGPWALAVFLATVIFLPSAQSFAADKINMLYTARVMSQAYPWFAQEAGLFKKYNLDVPLVFVTPGAPAVAAILSGDSEVAVIGAAGIYVGDTDDAPGAALLGIVLMIGMLVLGVRTARRTT